MAGVATRGSSLSAGLGAAHVMAEPKAAGLVHAMPAPAGVQSSGDGGAACVPAVHTACVPQTWSPGHMRCLSFDVGTEHTLALRAQG